MELLKDEAALFRARKAREIEEARQRVAVRLCCGIDLPDTGTAGRDVLMQAAGRIRRAIQRERMKAAVAHWSYDLNRHIGLKQALDEVLRALAGGAAAVETGEARAVKGNGARRRRYVWHA